MSLNQILFDQHWFLSGVFLLLIILSLVSWYVIFRKFFFLKNEKEALARFSAEKNSAESASQVLLHKAFLIVAERNKTSHEIARKKLHLLFEEFKERINFGQNFLASIANLTPFIGLFGTVIGVYLALMDISTEGSANIAVVAKPIGEALIATAIGLWCAIPASFAFNFFSKKSSFLLRKVKLVIDEKMIEIEEGK